MADTNFFEDFLYRGKWRILLISFFISLMGIIMVLLILCYQIVTLCRHYSRRYDANSDDLGKKPLDRTLCGIIHATFNMARDNVGHIIILYGLY